MVLGSGIVTDPRGLSQTCYRHPRPFSTSPRLPHPIVVVKSRTESTRPGTARCAAASGGGIQTAPMLRKLKSPDDNTCEIFIDEHGDIIQVMCCDYGFRSGFGRLYQGGDGEIPANFLTLGIQNFAKEYAQLRRSFRFNEYKEISRANPPSNPVTKFFAGAWGRLVYSFSQIDKRLEERGLLKKLEPNPVPEDVFNERGELIDECAEIREKLKQLKLDDAAVWKREHARKNDPERVRPPFLIKAAYLALCWTLDVVYANRPLQRFWFLETVARMPYFSYISMLHLYESLGWWRAGAELRKIHFAEEWNELHHLQIMEALGGDQLWVDRFLAQHAAVFYYWTLVLFFLFSPTLSYAFSELVETHAVDTYAQFVDDNAELLKSLPPPRVALEYYKSGDMYLYDELQTANRDNLRRPSCSNMYDVFCNIRDDELEHVKTMKACRDYSIADDLSARRLSSFAPLSTLSMSDDMNAALAASGLSRNRAADTATPLTSKPTSGTMDEATGRGNGSSNGDSSPSKAVSGLVGSSVKEGASGIGNGSGLKSDGLGHESGNGSSAPDSGVKTMDSSQLS